MDEDPTRDDPAYYAALGRAIQVARTELGFSRRDLAARARVSYTYLADIENGRRRPSSTPLLAISRALSLTPSELLARAEVYYSRGTGRPFVEPLLDEGVSDLPVHRARRAFGPPESEEPSPRRYRREIGPFWAPGPRSPVRERSAGSAPRGGLAELTRLELDELLGQLSPADLRLVLELVRRMTSR